MNTEKGMSLIELIVTVAVSSIVVALGWGLYIGIQSQVMAQTIKSTENTEVQDFVERLKQHVQWGKGIVFLSEDKIHLFDKRGMLLRYEYDGDKLYLNEEPLKWNVMEFSVKVWGKAKPVEELSSWEEELLDMYDLDRDASYALEGIETLTIGLVSVFINVDTGKRYSFTVHPRNRETVGEGKF